MKCEKRIKVEKKIEYILELNPDERSALKYVAKMIFARGIRSFDADISFRQASIISDTVRSMIEVFDESVTESEDEVVD